jgi:hypothetical protein
MTAKLTTPDGFVYEVETTEEAVRIQALIQGHQVNGSAIRKPRRSRPSENGSNAEPISDTRSDNLKKVEEDLLEALARAPTGWLTTDELAKKIGIPAANLPPVIRSVRKRTDAKFGRDSLVREQIYDEGKPKSRYRLSDRAIEELNK